MTLFEVPLSYVKDFDDKIKSELSLWVNGRYVQDDPSVTSQLKGKTIEQLQASCAGDITSIFMRTFDPAADLSTQPAWFTISIDLNGKVIADGA